MSEDFTFYVSDTQKTYPTSTYLPLVDEERNPLSVRYFEYDKDVRDGIREYLYTLQYPYREHDHSCFGEMRTAIKRFCISLDAYIESNGPIPTSELIRIGTKKDGAEFLKKMKFRAILENFDAYTLDVEDLSRYPLYPIKDIGDMFKPEWAFPWEEPDPEDYKYASIPVGPIDTELYSSIFEEILDELDENFEPTPWIESASKVSGSVTRDGSFNWYAASEAGYEPVIKDELIGRRVIIPVNPGGFRDGQLCDIETLRCIQYIDDNIRRIVEKLPESLMVERHTSFLEKIEVLREEYSFYYCRDLKKEGITKPRILLQLIGKTLEEKYGKSLLTECFKVYSDWTLEVGDELYETNRGHGLGFANSLTTLMQIIIHRSNLFLMPDEFQEADIMALAYNDDFVVGFKFEHIMHEYEVQDEVMMEKYSLIRNLKKTFFSKKFVICEEYWGVFLNKKQSFKRREILNSLVCVNVTHAKMYIASLMGSVEPYIDEYLPEITDTFGYEFFPEEISFPARFGGWWSRSTEGVSFDLVDAESLTSENYKAYYACKESFRSPNPFIRKKFKRGKLDKKEKYFSAIHHMLGTDELSDEICSELNIPLTYLDASRKWGNRRFLQFAASAWKDLYKRRQKVFNETVCEGFNELEFLERVARENEQIDFIPPEDLVKEVLHVDIIDSDFEIYRCDTPLLCYLSSIDEELGYYPTKYYMLNRSARYSLNPRVAKMERILKNDPSFFIMPYRVLGTPHHDSVNVDCLYNNPKAVLSASDYLKRGFPVPVWADEEFLVKKKEIFVRIPTPFERLCFIENKIRNPHLINLILNANMTEDELLCFFEVDDDVVYSEESSSDSYMPESSEDIEYDEPRYWEWYYSPSKFNVDVTYLEILYRFSYIFDSVGFVEKGIYEDPRKKGPLGRLDISLAKVVGIEVYPWRDGTHRLITEDITESYDSDESGDLNWFDGSSSY